MGRPTSQPLGEPPRPFQMRVDGVLEIVQGGGCIAVFGFPFFAVGIWALLHPPSDPSVSHLASALSGLPFILVGGLLMFARRRLRVDTTAGTASAEFSIVVQVHRRERHLSEFSAVALTLQTDSESADVYPVVLRADAGKDFKLTTPAKFSEAHAQAEYLSRLLKLPLVDTISDRESAVSPEWAGAPLRDRDAAGKSESTRPVAPPQMRCQVDESRTEAIITIPGKRAGSFFSLIVVAGAVCGGLMFLKVFVGATAPMWVRAAFAIFIGLVFVLPALLSAVKFL